VVLRWGCRATSAKTRDDSRTKEQERGGYLWGSRSWFGRGRRHELIPWAPQCRGDNQDVRGRVRKAPTTRDAFIRRTSGPSLVLERLLRGKLATKKADVKSYNLQRLVPKFVPSGSGESSRLLLGRTCNSRAAGAPGKKEHEIPPSTRGKGTRGQVTEHNGRGSRGRRKGEVQRTASLQTVRRSKPMLRCRNGTINAERGGSENDEARHRPQPEGGGSMGGFVSS